VEISGMNLGDLTECSYVKDFAILPARMFLELADIADRAGNERMRRAWIANYLRITEGRAA